MQEPEEHPAADTCGGNYECKNVVTRQYGSDDHGLCLDCGYDWTAALDVIGWDDDDEDEEEYEGDY